MTSSLLRVLLRSPSPHVWVYLTHSLMSAFSATLEATLKTSSVKTTCCSRWLSKCFSWTFTKICLLSIIWGRKVHHTIFSRLEFTLNFSGYKSFQEKKKSWKQGFSINPLLSAFTAVLWRWGSLKKEWVNLPSLGVITSHAKVTIIKTAIEVSSPSRN